MPTQIDNVKDMWKSFSAKVLRFRSKKILLLILLGISVVVTACAIYFGLMPFNIADGGFRIYIIFMLLLWSVPLISEFNHGATPKPKLKSGWGAPVFVAAGLVVVMMVVSFFVSPLFISKSYRELLSVQEGADFATGVENFDTMQIPVVDAALAKKLGDKMLGDGSYGSQFQINNYSMISIKNKLFWVAPIEYIGFFQWADSGVSPGYIKIDALNIEDVKIIKTPLKFLDSAFFGDDLQRKMYFANMFAMRSGRPHLELDDNEKPMFVESVLQKTFAFSSGTDTVGAIITNAVTGESKYYKTSDVPAWVDLIQPENVVIEQIGFWGQYVHGFFNTIFSKKELLQPSQGVNYIFSKDKDAENGRMFMYTGMTSIGADESIAGMLLTDTRTKQSYLYNLEGGATEVAAAGSAEGKVADLKYKASEPILINYNGEPTYFMTLKDAEGLVKKYAYVNVKNYSLVSVNDDRLEALNAYAMLIGQKSPVSDVKQLKITSNWSVVINGNTTILLKFDTSSLDAVKDAALIKNLKDKVLPASIQLDYNLVNAKIGDTIGVVFSSTDEEIVIKDIIIT